MNDQPVSANEERLQKILARAGLGSRRDCDALVEQGRVTVNGRVAEPGTKANPFKDTILVDGRKINAPEPLQYLAFHKPRGVISAVESPDPRPTVLDLVPSETRLFPVGRLDTESEGLILLTNDGDLANRITHPRFGVEKEYKALVAGRPDERQLETWRRGVVLADGHRTLPAKVRVEEPSGDNTWLRIIMHEGRKRQIREIGDQIGLPVLRLIRVRIGTLQLGNLKLRQYRNLSPKEVDSLKDMVIRGAQQIVKRAGGAKKKTQKR
ncbi:MAG: rRNA pseudouridine synthase [Anaerolineales bacterium]|nr:rRNA pseudouridine synthase [Anaerolineales bacterium]